MDRQPLSSQGIRDLWARGKFWEIFGFSSGDFTTLELAKQYSALTRAYHDSPEDKRMIDDVFATLNAPLTRQFYENCRAVMQRIRHEVGDTRFGDAEHRIWLDLWNWVSERWQEPPEDLIDAIKNKYHHSSSRGTVGQTEKWSDEGLKPADLDSVMAAESFAKEVKCQRCGKFDHTLRVVAFPYVISIVIASFKRFDESGVFCHRCRCTKSIKWAIVSLLFGWWSIWGFFWNIGALIDNFRGGKMPRENNEPLVAKLAWANTVLGRIAEAKAALKELFKYSPSEDTLRFQRDLDEKYPEVSPAKVERFRLGYLTVVFAILGVYAVAGIVMFGGTSTAPTTPSRVTPGFTSPMKSTPAPPPAPSPTPQPKPKSTPTPNTPTKPAPSATPQPKPKSTPTPNTPTNTPTSTSSPSSNLLIYLDENYTKLWDSTNVPDLNNIPWSSPTPDGPYKWQTGTLIAYLKNVGNITIEVSASATERPGLAIPGISVSSNKVILRPNERSPITITIHQSPEVLSWSSSSTGTTIYFHISAR